MARGMPSMVALLGLLAVAGYQNREKIAGMLGGTAKPGAGIPGQSGLDRILKNLGGALGGAGAGTLLNGGLGELLARFKQNGQGETADSWVKTGPNQPVTSTQLEQALGPDTLKALVEQTGLSREDLLSRLARALPDAVDKYTPEGRLPREEEAVNPA